MLRRAADGREPTPGAGAAGGAEEPGEDASGDAAGGAAGGQDVSRAVGGRPTGQRGAGGAEGAGTAPARPGTSGDPHRSDRSSRATETEAQGTEGGKFQAQGLHFVILRLKYRVDPSEGGVPLW